MIDLVKNNHISTIQKFLLIVLLVVFCTGCELFSDNATRLAFRLESAFNILKSQKNGSVVIIPYESDDSKAPFTILIIPKNGTTSDELYRNGLDSNIVEHLFGIKKEGGLIVFQNGNISNTTYYRNFVEVTATQIIKGSGKIDIVVKKVGVGPGTLTKEVMLIELRKQIKK